MLAILGANRAQEERVKLAKLTAWFSGSLAQTPSDKFPDFYEFLGIDKIENKQSEEITATQSQQNARMWGAILRAG